MQHFLEAGTTPRRTQSPLPLEKPMTKYSIGDHVSWNSEAGRVSGKIIKVHHQDFDYKGHRHHTSKDEPQYEIKSDKTDHVAAHKEGALTRIE
jgi:hypothetical protein